MNAGGRTPGDLVVVGVVATLADVQDPGAEVEVDQPGRQHHLGNEVALREIPPVGRGDRLGRVDRQRVRRCDRVDPRTEVRPVPDPPDGAIHGAIPLIARVRSVEAVAVDGKVGHSGRFPSQVEGDPVTSDHHTSVGAQVGPVQPAPEPPGPGDPAPGDGRLPPGHGREVAVVEAGLARPVHDGHLPPTEPGGQTSEPGVEVQTVGGVVAAARRYRQRSPQIPVATRFERTEGVQTVVSSVERDGDEDRAGPRRLRPDCVGEQRGHGDGGTTRGQGRLEEPPTIDK